MATQAVAEEHTAAQAQHAFHAGGAVEQEVLLRCPARRRCRTLRCRIDIAAQAQCFDHRDHVVATGNDAADIGDLDFHAIIRIQRGRQLRRGRRNTWHVLPSHALPTLRQCLGIGTCHHIGRLACSGFQ
ncbi:hypothetical protein D3C71_1707480 [compost metagenome]